MLPVGSLSGWLVKNSHYYILGEGQANGQLHFGEVMLPWEFQEVTCPNLAHHGGCPGEDGEYEGSSLV